MFRLNDRLITLDAHGTLLRLEPPAMRLATALADAGYPNEPVQVERAITAEIAYYLQHLNDGRDDAALRELRARCARIVHECLDNPPPVAAMTDLLMGSMVFRLYPDTPAALAALRAGGYRLAVVSNWDCSLRSTLARLGISGYFDTVVTSAEAGCSKPDPRVFALALTRLGVSARRALHCGDAPDADCEGARRAGMQAVYMQRDRSGPTGWPCVTIASLGELRDAADAVFGACRDR